MEGQSWLGQAYQPSLVEPQNYANAARLYRLSAAQGYATTQSKLGFVSQHGLGAMEFSKALKRYRAAADMRSPKASARIRSLYAHGADIGRDFAEAAKWHLSAAKLENIPVQLTLSGIHMEGQSVTKDLVRA